MARLKEYQAWSDGIKNAWRREEPNLNSEAIAVVYGPTTGGINPYEACLLLLESACRNGVVFQGESPVTGLTRQEDRWLINTPQGEVAARFVINAAGLYVADKADDRTSQEGAQEVFESVTRLVPGITARDCIAEFAGLRAVADTEDFVIGPTAQPGFINVAGIHLIMARRLSLEGVEVAGVFEIMPHANGLNGNGSPRGGIALNAAQSLIRAINQAGP